MEHDPMAQDKKMGNSIKSSNIKNLDQGKVCYNQKEQNLEKLTKVEFTV